MSSLDFSVSDTAMTEWCIAMLSKRTVLRTILVVRVVHLSLLVLQLVLVLEPL